MGLLNDWRSRPRKPRPDLAERNRRNAQHGMTKTPTFKTWDAMCQRIFNQHCRDYARYGGRGLDMDPRWRSFQVFVNDMGIRPPGRTLGRIDNDSGYWPSNCRWETARQQNNNRRSNRIVTIRGQAMTVAQWARLVGISRQGMRYRLEAGWSDEQLMSQCDQFKRRA